MLQAARTADAGRSLGAVVSKPICRHLLIPIAMLWGLFASPGITTHVVQPCRSLTVGRRREANSANKLYFLAAPPGFPGFPVSRGWMIQSAGIQLSGKDRCSFRVYQRVTSKPAIRRKFVVVIILSDSSDSYMRSRTCALPVILHRTFRGEGSLVLTVSYAVGRECIEPKFYLRPVRHQIINCPHAYASRLRCGEDSESVLFFLARQAAKGSMMYSTSSLKSKIAARMRLTVGEFDPALGHYLNAVPCR